MAVKHLLVSAYLNKICIRWILSIIGRHSHKWQKNIKMDLTEIRGEGVDMIRHDLRYWQAGGPCKTLMALPFPYNFELHVQTRNCKLLKKGSALWGQLVSLEKCEIWYITRFHWCTLILEDMVLMQFWNTHLLYAHKLAWNGSEQCSGWWKDCTIVSIKTCTQAVLQKYRLAQWHTQPFIQSLPWALSL
jgi:hypothetical protein